MQPVYIQSRWSRLLKSKAAMADMSWRLGFTLCLVIVSLTLTALIYIGLQAYQRCLLTQDRLLDTVLARFVACEACEPYTFPYADVTKPVCERCTASMSFSSMQLERTQAAQRQTAQAIHDALGWLWNWYGTTRPAEELSRCIHWLSLHGALGTFVSLASGVIWLVYLLIQHYTTQGIRSFRRQMQDAQTTLPRGYRAGPSAAALAEAAWSQQPPLSSLYDNDEEEEKFSTSNDSMFETPSTLQRRTIANAAYLTKARASTPATFHV